MSRWRETLCGSAIKTGEPNLESQVHRFTDNAKTLTCGGSFLPQPRAHPFFSLARPQVLHLPKNEQEVLVFNQQKQSQRYGGEMDPIQELDLEDLRLEDTELKLPK